jgi:DNA topoisomerase IB
MAEIWHDVSPRIGGSSSETYGLSTLLVKQINFNDGFVSIIYPGKDGVKQKHVLKADTPRRKTVIRELKNLCKGKAPSEYVFTVDDEHISANKFREYLKQIGFKGNPHKIRTIRGTGLAKKIIQDENWAPPKNLSSNIDKKQKAAEDWFKKKVAFKVAHQLGHKKKDGSGDLLPMTSIKNYIDPSVPYDFFTGHKLRVPKWVPQK